MTALSRQFTFITNHPQFVAQLNAKKSPLAKVAREVFIDLH